LLSCDKKKFNNPNDPINRISAPKIIFPPNDTLIRDNPLPFFEWKSPVDTLYPYSIIYELHCAKDKEFKDLLFYRFTQATAYYSTKLIDTETCFWRVRAKPEDVSDELWSDWSEIGTFKIRFPVVGENNDIPRQKRIIIRDNYAYIIYENTFHILDLSNYSSPQLISSFEDTNVYEFWNMEKDGNYLYFLGRDNNYYYHCLRIYSISDPSNPQITSSCSLYFSYSPYIAISYPAMYVRTYESKIAIVDISDPKNPFVKDSMDVNMRILNFTVKEKHLLLFVETGIRVYDISSPFSPNIVNNYSFYYPRIFYLHQDSLFVTRYPDTVITILDVSSLPEIKRINSFSVNEYISDMCFLNNCLIVNNIVNRFYIYELEGGPPFPEGTIFEEYYYDFAGVYKNYLYLFERSGSVIVVKL
jgi:hypothetical protein